MDKKDISDICFEKLSSSLDFFILWRIIFEWYQRIPMWNFRRKFSRNLFLYFIINFVIFINFVVDKDQITIVHIFFPNNCEQVSETCHKVFKSFL